MHAQNIESFASEAFDGYLEGICLLWSSELYYIYPAQLGGHDIL